MTSRGQDIASSLKQQIGRFGIEVTAVDVGTVIEVGDGIARIQGLVTAKYSELLQFPNDVMGIALNLEEDSVSAVVLGDYTQIKEGDEVKCTGRIAEVPVGDALIGRVVDALGRPLGANRREHRRLIAGLVDGDDDDFTVLQRSVCGEEGHVERAGLGEIGRPVKRACPIAVVHE